MVRQLWAATAVLLVLSACSNTSQPSAAAPAAAHAPRSDCENSVNPASFATVKDLWALETKLDSYGLRATGNPAHQSYVGWLEDELRQIPGLQLRTEDFPITRWTPKVASLEAGPSLGLTRPIPISAVVPYAKPTPADGTLAPLVYIPPGTEITSDNAAGKIVLRDVVAGTQKNAALLAVLWWLYDPDETFARQINGTMENKQGVAKEEMEAASAAGAAGLIYLHEFPREQVLDLYRPYEGVHWSIPALQVGVDEATTLKTLAAQGGYARISLAAVDDVVSTRMLIASLPGQAEDAIVVESHTDGTSALWDNGPLAMLAMARYFGQFDASCRPRTLRFVFTTAHLYQTLAPPYRGGSANLYAEEVDRDYNDGKAAAVVVIEHLGAREYDAVPRAEGLPGRQLELTDGHERNTFFVTESAGLLDTLYQSVSRHDLRESFALRGTSAPGAHLPVSNNFGGEGNAYINHLLPTVAFIVAPWTLFTPEYSLQGIDRDLMYQQTLVFADLVQAMSSMPREVLAGAMTAERAQRDVLCASGADVSAIVQCDSTPSMPGGR